MLSKELVAASTVPVPCIITAGVNPNALMHSHREAA